MLTLSLGDTIIISLSMTTEKVFKGQFLWGEILKERKKEMKILLKVFLFDNEDG